MREPARPPVVKNKPDSFKVGSAQRGKRRPPRRNHLPVVLLLASLAMLSCYLAFKDVTWDSNPLTTTDLNEIAFFETPTIGAVNPPLNPLTLPPLANKTPVTTAIALPKAANLADQLRPTLSQATELMGENADYSVVVNNLKTGEKFTFNENKPMLSASVYKIFVMLTVYNEVSKGSLSLDSNITLTAGAAAADDDGGTLIVPIGQSLPVRNLLEAMIMDSNNTAALMLLFQVRPAKLVQVTNDLGFKGCDFSDTWNFKVTAADVSSFFTRVATNKLLGDKYDPQMLDLLTRTHFTKPLPALLPTGTKVAHKIGDLGTITHDAGIIFLPNGEQVGVTVLTSNSNATGARQFISQLGLDAYRFYAPKA